jgi:flavin reductase (DIM6/NTAB) family NADH-FMN oxidoreductase RutF
MPLNAPSCGPEELRRVAAAFPTGVVLLTVGAVPGGYGTTIGTFVVVSLDPPLVSVCLQIGCRTLALLPQRTPFGISVLTADQGDLARRYARRDRPRGLDELPVWLGRRPGVVTLASAAAGFECCVVQHVDLGDHVMVLASVDVAWRADATPLLHLNGRLTPAGAVRSAQPA